MSGLSGVMQRRIKDVQTRATEKSDGVRQWILQPFVALRDRAVRLPGQTQRLSHQISLLEVLIELQVAELDVSLGTVPAVQARMVRLRVVANVVLPELARKLAEAAPQRCGVRRVSPTPRGRARGGRHQGRRLRRTSG